MVAINTRETWRVSISDTETEADSGGNDAGFSEDGRYVVFTSGSTDLQPVIVGFTQIYVRDTLTGTTTIVSTSSGGELGQGLSREASISADGRFILFRSTAFNLQPGDNAGENAFLRDMATGTVVRVSESATGEAVNQTITGARLAAEGRYAVFQTAATNLIPGLVAGGHAEIFRKDLLTGEVELVSATPGGDDGSAGSIDPEVSPDGRFVVFSSNATDLVVGDTNGEQDVFLRDLALGTTQRISVSSSEAQGLGGDSVGAALSADGRYVVFESNASGLAPGQGLNQIDVFLRDTVAGTTSLVSRNSAGVTANNFSRHADVSDDGRYVVFTSDASNLVEGDTNLLPDVFLRDLLTGVTIRLSVGPGGVQAVGGTSELPSISANGQYVLFESNASNLIAGDTNGSNDVFRVSLFATSGADLLIGSDAADTINGLGGADVIRGGLGDDTLDGGTGQDTLEGGLGDDLYRVDFSADRVTEAVAGGVDNVVSTVSYALRAGQEIETLQLSMTTGSAALNLTGNEFNNTLRGNTGNNILNGAGGVDSMYGLAGNDIYVVDNAIDQVFESVASGLDTVITTVTYTLGATTSVEQLTLSSTVGAAALNLTGNAFVNTLQGYIGDNVLDGKGGPDTLTGLGGDDVFAFSTALGGGNIDTITDFGFAVGNNDFLRLENAIFTALNVVGQLAPEAFQANATGLATQVDDRIIYETDTGALFYDADGVGGVGGVQFANVGAGLPIGAGDFFVV